MRQKKAQDFTSSSTDSLPKVENVRIGRLKTKWLLTETSENR